MTPSWRRGLAGCALCSNVTAAQWVSIKQKRLRVYLEFPRDLEEGPFDVMQTLWERAVVTSGCGLG